MVDKFEKPQIICHLEKNLDYSIYDVKWIPASAKFVVMGGKSNGAGLIEIYSFSTNGIEKQGEISKKEYFKCGTFDASTLSDRHLATGDFGGRLQVWYILNIPPYDRLLKSRL